VKASRRTHSRLLCLATLGFASGAATVKEQLEHVRDGLCALEGAFVRRALCWLLGACGRTTVCRSNLCLVGRSLKKKHTHTHTQELAPSGRWFHLVWGSQIRPQIYIYMDRIKSYDLKRTEKKKKSPLPATKTKLLHTTPPSPVTAQQRRRPRAPTDQPPPWHRPQPASPLPPRRPRRGPRLGLGS